jgi:hypothetical protein
MSKFDISLSFDDAKYLNPQLYVFFNSLEDKIPDDVVIHIVTTRDRTDDVIQYALDRFDVVLYNKPPFTDLKSRCQYMFHCFEVETNKPWLIKMESDFIFLKHLDELNNILDDDYDLILEPENRKIFDDDTANRLWRIIYRAMNIECPTQKITFRENKEDGLPLFGTGMVCVKSKHLHTINERWHDLIKICEQWIDYNIHPNEFAFTGLVFDEGWKWKIYDDKYKFNPIGHFRAEPFPCTRLVDNCVLPDDVVIFDYHRPNWLIHVSKWNPYIKDVLNRNSQYLTKEWKSLSNIDFQETKNV